MDETLDQGVAPPEQMNESVKPAIPGQQSSIAQVSLDHPTRFKTMISNATSGTPEGRIALGKEITNRSKESEDEDPNSQMQLGKMAVSLLTGHLGEAYKWYNGGGQYWDKGVDASGNVYQVARNERGILPSKMKDANGHDLSPEAIKAINEKGGLVTNQDRTAKDSLSWSMYQKAKQDAQEGITSQFNSARTKARTAANILGAANRNADEEIGLVAKNHKVFDTLANLSDKDRQELFGYVQKMRQLGQSSGASNQNYGGATSGNNEQVGVSGKVPGVGIGGSYSGGQNNSASQSQTNAANNSINNSNQEMQNLQSLIMQKMQGAIADPQGFKDFMRVIDLNEANKTSNSQIPADIKFKGYQDVVSPDVFTGGHENIVKSLMAQQANNALIAAYNEELYKAQKEQFANGKVSTPEEIEDRLMKSEKMQGIKNWYQDRLEGFTNPARPRSSLIRGSAIYNPKTNQVEYVQ